jgi:hypothetical protein
MKRKLAFLVLCIAVLMSCNMRKNLWDRFSENLFSMTSIDPSSLTLNMSASHTLTASYSAVDELTYTFSWSIDDPGVAAISSTAGTSVDLTGSFPGDCTVTVICDQTGDSATCPVHIRSNSADLASLEITPQGKNSLEYLDPSFTASGTSYFYMPVKYKYANLSVQASTKESHAMISATLNGAALSDTGSSVTLAINNLVVGNNTLVISVAAEDGTVKDYSISVYRAVPVFKTGQTASYVTGDDGALQKGIDWPSPRFVVLSATEVQDTMTGLIWYRNSVGTFTAWSDAFSMIPTALSSVGAWRCPNTREMRSLISYATVKPNVELTNNYWSSVPGGYYWLSTRPVISPGTYERVCSFDTGKNLVVSSFTCNLLPVSSTGNLPKTGYNDYSTSATAQGPAYGVDWPSPRFRKSPDGLTVIDVMTGLVWMADPGTVAQADWPSSFTSVAALNASAFGGHTDWRLPNINELETLVHYGYQPVSDWLISQGIKVQTSGTYWTSTTRYYDVAGSPSTDNNCAWMISLGACEINIQYKTGYSYYVLPVCGSSD